MKNNKIVIFIAGYLPAKKYGGPVTSIANFVEVMGDEWNIFIVSHDHDYNDTNRLPGIKVGWNQVGKAKVLYLSENKFTQETFSEIIDNLSPAIMYASSIFSAKINLPLLSISKQKNIPILLAPRGELNSSALRRKKYKKAVYLLFLKLTNKLSNVYFQATSLDERLNIINSLSVVQEKVFLLPNVPVAMKQKVNINKEKGKAKICYVGRIVPNKNLDYAIKTVQKATCNVEFDIFGPNADKLYWDKCKEMISKSPSNIKIRYKGLLSSFEINEVYSRYDCLISPTLFENYGQAIVESMLHDTPVIISEGTTPWDSISKFKAGYVIPLDKQNDFTNAVDKIGHMGNNEYLKLIENLRNYCIFTFNFEELKAKYNDAFKIIIG